MVTQTCADPPHLTCIMWLTMQICLLTFSPPCTASSSMLCFMFQQLPGHASCVLPEEANQLQPPHQSQQPLRHLSRCWWNQSDAPYWLWKWPASLLAAGASQRGHGQHEQCSWGLSVCVCDLNSKSHSTNRWPSKPKHFWHYKVVSSSYTVCTKYYKTDLTSFQSSESFTSRVMSFFLLLMQLSSLWSPACSLSFVSYLSNEYERVLK